MIHYHGTPITPNSAAAKVLAGRHAFVSFARPDQLEIAIEVCQSLAVDNGAFSAWKGGAAVTDWRRYYAWVADLHRLPCFDFAVIPDVIDGDEAANDALVAEWPWRGSAKDGWIGAPVWHMHESIERLVRLAFEWQRVCIGSSGDYATVGSPAWWNRITEAMNAVCDRDGRPVTKLHGLRMLNPEVFKHLPFSSADSTNIAQNINIDGKWSGSYQPPDKDWRALLMASRIESNNAPCRWHERHFQENLL